MKDNALYIPSDIHITLYLLATTFIAVHPKPRACVALALRTFSKRLIRYGVLSTYVQDFPFLNHNIGKTWEVSHLCEVLFSAFRPRNQRARVRCFPLASSAKRIVIFSELQSKTLGLFLITSSSGKQRVRCLECEKSSLLPACC